MIEAGRAFAAPHAIDGIVALGGGSSLDAGKGINFLLTNGGAIGDYRGYGKARRPLLPAIGIPTTAGTGSEAQSYAVISDAATHAKMACGDPTAAFRIALLDPSLAATAPRHVTAMAGFDAIAHAVETAVTAKRTPMSDLYSHEAWRLLAGAFERVLLHPADIEARAAMQIGSYFAGVAIEQSMLGAAHACANPVTARYGVAHGLALAILLPTVVRWNASVARDRYNALLGSPGRARARRRWRGIAGAAPGRSDRRRRTGVDVEAGGRRSDGAPRARGTGRRAVDRNVQPPSIRRHGRPRDLQRCVLRFESALPQSRTCPPPTTSA